MIRRIKWLVGMSLYMLILPLIAPLLLLYLVLIYLATFLPATITRKYFRPVARHWCKMFTRALLVNLQVVYETDQPLPEKYILVANHPSIFEDFGIPSYFDIHPLAKAGVRDWWFLGRVSEYGGTIFVRRSDRDSRKNALAAMIGAVEQGNNLVIFPEGGCKGRRIHSSFQTGAFDISIRTGVPIQPVFLHYEEQDRFEWHDPHTLLHKFWHFMTAQNNRANYYVYDAISPQGFSNKHAFAEHVHRQYLQWQQRYLD